MELSHLHTFLTVARIGHMTRAAGELHLTQPAVSAQIARLEESLGQSLFDRTPKGMVLTESGRVFRGYAEDALARLSEGRSALEELAGLERGAMAIGGGATATTYLLPPLLGRFHARYPTIRLFVREQGSQSVVDGVLRGELDLGVVTLPIDPSQAAVSNPLARLEVEEWVEDELRLIVPHDHELAGREQVDWEDLDGEPLVLFEAGSAVRSILDRAMAEAQIQTEIVMELRSIESIKQMVAQGIGSSFVSRFALPSPKAGIPLADHGVARQLAIIYRTDRTLSSAARAFLELMQEPQR